MTKRERTKNAALRVRDLALDAVVRKWTDMAEFFARRPATVMCVIVGAFICVGMSTWALVKSENTSDAISQRMITSCARALNEVAVDVADNATKQDIEKRWTGYADKFSAVYPPGAATCEETFPKQKLFWVFTP